MDGYMDMWGNYVTWRRIWVGLIDELDDSVWK